MVHHHCAHGHSHHHHHHFVSSDRLSAAVFVNILLTFVQIIAGVLSGSLSLIADALHNFSDAAALFIALAAHKISRKHADHKRTFGYKRVETIAALINLTVLVVVGVYLSFEAVMRFISPEPVQGWIVVVVAGIAFLIDFATVLLLRKDSSDNLNIRAAYLHNIADALSSIAVMVGGAAIIFFRWYWVDAVMTLAISFYVLYLSVDAFSPVVNVLLNGAPSCASGDDMKRFILSQRYVRDVNAVYVWQVDEDKNAVTAHIILHEGCDIVSSTDLLKNAIQQQYDIDLITIECSY